MPRRFAILLILVAGLCCRALAAPEQWIEFSSEHFTVLTGSNDKEGRHILDQFERMRWLFHTLFPKANVDPALPIMVIGTKNEKGFQLLEPAAYLAKGQLHLGRLFVKAPEKVVAIEPTPKHPTEPPTGPKHFAIGVIRGVKCSYPDDPRIASSHRQEASLALHQQLLKSI